MIFERREYVLRPGRLNDFWDAQRSWNVGPATSELLRANLGYFATFEGNADRVVHLYRFDSVEAWRTSYLQYYLDQDVEYFTSVRPWVLSQRTSLLTAPPEASLASLWCEPEPRLPDGVAALVGERVEPIVTEETTDLLPGALARYWPELKGYRDSAPDEAATALGVLVTLVGRLHRVHEYHAFPDERRARQHVEARRANTDWRRFVAALGDDITASRTLTLTPSPVPEQRSLITPDRSARS